MARREELLVLSPGEVFDRRYRVVRELGRGGFAAVYLAEHLEIGHRVAIKLLHSHRSDARFVREGKVLSQLRSPHTVRMLDFGRTDEDCPFIICDYVDGTPVDEVVRGRGAMTPDRVLLLLSQVLESLAEAHALGIVHRDLKPANLFLTTAGDVRVLDFGVAKLLPEAQRGNAALTNPGFAVGTPAYMAPEQLAGAPIVPATDLFSLGLVAWELLFGRRANDSRDVMRAAARQFGRRYTFDDAPLTGELVELLNSFVAQNVRRRPEDGSDALQRLEARWRPSDHGRGPQPPPEVRAPDLTDSSTTKVETPQVADDPVFSSWPTGFCWAIGPRVFWAGDGVQPVEHRLPDDFAVTALGASGVGLGHVGTRDGRVAQLGAEAIREVSLGAEITALASRDNVALAGTVDGRVVRLDDDSAPQSITAVNEPVRALATSRSGDAIAIGAGRTVFLRDTQSGTLRSRREVDGEVLSIVYSPDDYLVAILTPGELIVASALTLDSMVRFRNNRGKIVAVRFTDDGQLQTAVLHGDQLQVASVD